MDAPKIKASREEFAEVLCYFLANQVNTKAIQQLAKVIDVEGKPQELFGINIENKKNLNTLAEELFSLNMWMIVYSCERIFEDVAKRNECLDTFHLNVYQKILEGTEEDFGQWKLALTAKYIDYNEAMETESQPGPLWELAKVVNKNLFGKLNLSAIVQFEISAYASSNIKALMEMVNKYDIE
jgi:hypothetical protein